LGGWRFWRQIITSCLKGCYTASNIFETALETLNGEEAWARILAGCDRVMVAELLGMMLVVVPEWVAQGVEVC
jgi:hypothetical protein